MTYDLPDIDFDGALEVRTSAPSTRTKHGPYSKSFKFWHCRCGSEKPTPGNATKVNLSLQVGPTRFHLRCPCNSPSLHLPGCACPQSEEEKAPKRAKKEVPAQPFKFDCPHMEALSQRYAVRVPVMLSTTVPPLTRVCVLVLRVW